MSYCLHDQSDVPCDGVAEAESYVEVMVALAAAFQSNFNQGNLVVKIDKFLSDEEKNSVSATAVAFARVPHCTPHGTRVVMKWFLETDSNVTSESTIYSCAVYDLVRKLRHPCFAHPLCVAPPGTVNDKALINRVRRWLEPSVGANVGFIMTEYCGSRTFQDHVDSGLVGSFDSEFYSGVIQMIRALDAMANDDLVHGDLHFGNVMFPKYGEVRKNKAETVKIEAKGREKLVLGVENRLVKIFDWDRSLDKRFKHRKTPDSWRYILLFDKIGFLRQLNVTLDFEVNGVLGFDWLWGFDAVVKQTGTPDERHLQVTVLGELMKIKFADLSRWVAGALSRLEEFAFLKLKRK